MAKECRVKGCRSGEPTAVTYLDRAVCGRCWDRHGDKSSAEIRAVLGIKDKSGTPSALTLR